MRLKTFTAPTVAEAMKQVRAVLGTDAIIVSTYHGRRGRGVQVTAAKEPPQADPLPERAPEPDHRDAITHALHFHGVPEALTAPLAEAARSFAIDDPALALAAAFDARYTFTPMGEAAERPIMLVGPCGAGKTAVTAKLAAQAVLAGRRVGVVTTDTVRAGAVDQLAAFINILKQPLKTADSPEELAAAIDACGTCDLILIDTPGTNPFNRGEVADLKRFLDSGEFEPVAVLPAGRDAHDTGEMAATFAALGTRRLIATQLDAARRLGSVLTAIEAAKLSFAGASITPFISQGLTRINPVSFARLLLDGAAEPETATETGRAAS